MTPQNREASQMPRIVLAVAASLVAGFAAATWFMGGDAPAPVGGPAPLAFDPDASIEERIASLESALSAEQQARQLLEEEIVFLYEALDALEQAAANAAPNAVGNTTITTPDGRVVRGAFVGQAVSGNDADVAELRTQALVDAGFSETRASWILKRESELRMEAMQARYDMMRSGAEFNRFDPNLNPDRMLRDEIGDTEYTQYLQANGRPVDINVSEVYDTSPAQSAGLRPGDRITHYDGERIFNTYDLQRKIIAGEQGDNVVVNIERDGVPMQIVVPRGPLGIMSRGGR